MLHEQLAARGYEVVPFGEPADVGIINTCTVTRLAESKCRQVIRGFTRKNPEAFTAVIGCYSQTGAKALSEIPGVDLIVGNHDKMAVLDHVQLGKNPSPVILRERISPDDFAVSFVGDLPPLLRANLKVQDGCDFMCAFCIIPFARGRARARDFENVMAEARQLVANGVKEIVLTGVNIGTYSSHGHDILGLVDALNAIPALPRIRISSIEPTTIPVALLDRMADPAHSLVPYLHIPLQSGSNNVLGIMRRRYTKAEFAAFIEDAAKRVPDICIGTDIMVGHPGETDEDFAETCAFFTDLPMAYCHVFTYSERPGTLATKRSDHVTKPERDRRSAELRRISARAREHFNRAHLGRTYPVLFEHPKDGLWSGYTENYIRVVATNPPSDLTNQIVNVRLDRIAADFVEGSVA